VTLAFRVLKKGDRRFLASYGLHTIDEKIFGFDLTQ
jgi:hypothetical protein